MELIERGINEDAEAKKKADTVDDESRVVYSDQKHLAHRRILNIPNKIITFNQV